MPKTKVMLRAGYRLELWASGPGSVRISKDEATLWQVPAFAGHSAFYKYRHRETCEVTIEWDRPAAILWAYGYDPACVCDTGITVWEFGAESIVHRTGAEIDEWMRSDPDRPVLHFSPIRQWMNDPNGLCKVGDDWHVFYQFHPASTDWGPMHWGHATSKDLCHWTHLPVFLHPEQNYWSLGATGGAFSGNAFKDRDGTRMFFYTERLPAYDLFKGYREIQKLARPDRYFKTAESVAAVIETVPVEQGVEHDFRDPKVWWDEAANAYRMVLGAALRGDPAVLLYGSDNLHDWTYMHPLYRAPGHFRKHGARAVECPDFFPLGGKWVMVMGFVGYTEPDTRRHNLLYALVGDFKNDRFVPDSNELQILDFGTDYYAMQSFEAEGRQMALAWLFNWEYRKPAGSSYSGELSLPRQLSLDGRNRLCMRPADELDETLTHTALVPAEAGAYTLEDLPIDVRLEGSLDDTEIVASEAGETSFTIAVVDERISVHLPQDDGSIHYTAPVEGASDLRIVHDRGILEIFADGGAVCGTRRSYLNVRPDTLRIRSSAKVSAFSGKIR